jgi:hypothetical protein
MNSIGLVALVLGIISVIITLKYVRSYEHLDSNLNKISVNCLNKSAISELTKIQDSLNLNDHQMNKLIKLNKTAIKKLFKKNISKIKPNKEGFTNYIYTDHKQRNMGDFKFTGIIGDE